MSVSIVQWCTEIGVFNARLNANHHITEASVFRDHVIYIIRSCLPLLLLLVCAGDIELKRGPKKEILVIIFHCVIGISTVLLPITF